MLKQNAELGLLTNCLRTIPEGASPIEEIKAVLDFGIDLYDKLCTAQLWIKPGKGGGDTALNTIVQQVVECWNCGAKGHTAQVCPKPKNTELYKKNHKAFYDKKSGGSIGSGGGNRAFRGTKSDSNTGYNRKAWEARMAKKHMKINTDGFFQCLC